MDDVIKWINLILSLLAIGVIGYLWKAIKAQKETVNTQSKTIEAQKTIVDNFKAQSDYLKNVQSTVTELYNPKTIENIIKAKEQEIEFNIKELHNKETDEILNELRKYKSSFNRLIIMAAGFRFTDENRFNSASEAVELENFELDAIEELRIAFGFHKRKQKMRSWPPLTDKTSF